MTLLCRLMHPRVFKYPLPLLGTSLACVLAIAEFLEPAGEMSCTIHHCLLIARPQSMVFLLPWFCLYFSDTVIPTCLLYILTNQKSKVFGIKLVPCQACSDLDNFYNPVQRCISMVPCFKLFYCQMSKCEHYKTSYAFYMHKFCIHSSIYFMLHLSIAPVHCSLSVILVLPFHDTFLSTPLPYFICANTTLCIAVFLLSRVIVGHFHCKRLRIDQNQLKLRDSCLDFGRFGRFFKWDMRICPPAGCIA